MFLALVVMALPLTALAGTCESLTSLTINNTTIDSATAEAGYCRVLATAAPVTGSEIHIEIWLPAADRWNGKFLGTGNGGYSSALSTAAMRTAIEQPRAPTAAKKAAT